MIQNSLEGKSLLLEQNDCHKEDTSVRQVNQTIIDPKIVIADMAVLGQAKMVEICGLFSDGAQEILTQLDSVAGQNDQREIKQLAHKLKGSAGSLGLGALFDLCLEIEKAQQPCEIYLKQRSELWSLVEQSKHALDEILG